MSALPKFDLSRQTSHKYRAGWHHLDASEHVGTARVLAHKVRRESRHGDSRSTFSLLVVSSASPEAEVITAIYDTMRHGCRCEHDCCGHWQSHVSRVRRLKSGMYAVIESHSINC